jgi:hypothetical protein
VMMELLNAKGTSPITTADSLLSIYIHYDLSTCYSDYLLCGTHLRGIPALERVSMSMKMIHA